MLKKYLLLLLSTIISLVLSSLTSTPPKEKLIFMS
jgi:Histidine phosphatase superfamily (branch 2)